MSVKTAVMLAGCQKVQENKGTKYGTFMTLFYMKIKANGNNWQSQLNVAQM
jgi:hypothetical protein